jgi:DNA polymerase III subunit alpha
MVHILSARPVGVEPVYDIGLAQDHNFVLANGAVASNCFNKSHSTAYAYVTYQTAFLKANYPVEYMAALLTANSGDQDKITKYLSNCEQTLSIKVEPPDINRSDMHFTPVRGQKSILFGLSAIKNVGEGAIEAILATRHEGGEFTSLADLCQRINLQAVNSRNLESLIKCGAMDRLEPNRQQLTKDLELVVPWSQKRAKEKAVGQANLFDLMGGGAAKGETSFEAAPKAPTVPDFSAQERLQFELELLGVYVSDHPLKSAERVVRRQRIETVALSAIDKHLRKPIKLVVMFQEIKLTQTKKDNKSMAILKVTSMDGTQIPAVAFAEAYEKIKDRLAVNVPVILQGKAGRRDEELQIIVEDIELIDLSAAGEPDEFDDRMALIKIPLAMMEDEAHLQQLKTLLEEYAATDEYAAKTPVFGLIEAPDGQNKLVRFGEQFDIQSEELAIERLDKVFPAQLRLLPPELTDSAE